MKPRPGVFGTAGHLLRLARAGLILTREGVFADIDPELLPPRARPFRPLLTALAKKRRGPRETTLARAIERLGPSYVKLGQFLATRPDIVGMATARELESLRDRMPAFPREAAVAIVEGALGQPLPALFAGFGDAVAAASIAQVHRATLHPASADEHAVAVKVARPGVERRFAKDLADMMFAARLAERRSEEAQRLRLTQVVETLARSVKLEMDFRLEAAAAAEFAANNAGHSDFVVPAVDWDRTARNVLTTQWIDGVPLSDLPALRAAGIDTGALARLLLQSFLRHAMQDGFFHADMHQGNLFADRQGRLVAVDFGIMGRLGPKEQRFLAEILFGFIVKDYRRVAQVHFDAGYVPAHHSVEEFAQAIRAIGEPIHARRADEISMARLFTLLFEVTSLFEMKTRPELVLLQKTMVVVEGVARNLDPHLDIWRTAEPVVRGWIESNLGPGAALKDASQGLADLTRVVRRLPEMLGKVEVIADRLDTITRDGVAIAPSAVRGIETAQYRAQRFGHWALWLLAAGVLILVLR